jgi:hypothetical protein
MIHDEKTPIEYVLYGQFIKYSALRNLVALEFANSNADEVKIFIDLNQMLLPAFRYLKIQDYNVISSTIINYCAHLRSYFRTRHNVQSTIILVFSRNMSSNNTRFCAEYNSHYRLRMQSNEKIMDAVDYNLDILKILCPYLPDIYLKIGTVEPSVIMYDLISKDFNDNIPNIVISSSQYAYQLPGVARNTVVFKKKVANKIDTSFSYNMLNAINAFIYDTRDIVTNEILNTKTISLLMSLSGLPKRNIKSMFSIKTSLEIIQSIPDSSLGDIDAMYKCMEEHIRAKKTKTFLPYDEFVNRYKAIDLLYQHKLYEMLPESKEKSYLQRFSDPSTVRDINDRYFKNIPLDLERL